jgi:hypothetical protein
MRWFWPIRSCQEGNLGSDQIYVSFDRKFAEIGSAYVYHLILMYGKIFLAYSLNTFILFKLILQAC